MNNIHADFGGFAEGGLRKPGMWVTLEYTGITLEEIQAPKESRKTKSLRYTRRLLNSVYTSGNEVLESYEGQISQLAKW